MSSSRTTRTSPNNENKWTKNGFGEGVPDKTTGKFSMEESAQVRRAVEDYCAMKQISVARLCSECDHKAELKGAWMEIAKRLPHRSVQSIYRHGLRQLHPFKRGAWSEDECETLLDLVQSLGKKWALIQQKLHRSADSCRDKYREMSDEYVRGRWKDAEMQMLQRLVREHLQADPSTDFKDLAKMSKMAEAEGIRIPWSLISKRMGKRSRLSCFKKWQKMVTAGLDQQQDQQSKDDSSSDEESAPSKPSRATKTQSSSKARRVTSSGTTAGEAAALAAQDERNSDDFDIYLLTEIANYEANRTSDIDWDSMRIDNAKERWTELLEEWQRNSDLDESVLGLTVSEIAQAILDSKTSAQRAAETVEAVDLPPPEKLARDA